MTEVYTYGDVRFIAWWMVPIAVVQLVVMFAPHYGSTVLWVWVWGRVVWAVWQSR